MALGMNDNSVSATNICREYELVVLDTVSLAI